MLYSNISVAQSIVALCLAKEITHVVICPGSRNAPLIIGFSEHKNINAYSVVDERCAAFVALGIAQNIGKPVAVVCTSGSAVLNYYPAIAEAFYNTIPLVVISADRPTEHIDIGDGQTIRQEHVFTNHILYSANLKSISPKAIDTGAVSSEEIQNLRLYNEQQINIALNTAIERIGPVHINVPFYEPLYTTVTEPQSAPLNVPITTQENILSVDDLKVYQDIWNSSKRKLILIGQQQPNSILQEYLDMFAQDDSVIVMTETTSNVHHTSFLSGIDTIIAPIEKQIEASTWFNKLQPDILLTFGGFVVSKKIKAFLRTYKPKQHWHVDTTKAYNTYFSLSRHFQYTSNQFLKVFLKDVTSLKSNYFKFWNAIKLESETKKHQYMKTVEFSDIKVFYKLLPKLPKNSVLHLSNSSTIRYSQLFNIDKSIQVYCNRGTSGIDGSTSTAIGFAINSTKQNILITGDLSFFYDSNALWNTNIPNTFLIILINNNGGGIFRILPGQKDSKQFTKYFETTHKHNASHLAKMYKFNYHCITKEEELDTFLEAPFTSIKLPTILEIQTPNTVNDVALLHYFEAIKPK